MKSENGAAMRSLYQFFEIEALKKADLENLQPGTYFYYGASNERFQVLENTQERISVIRDKNGKVINAMKKYNDSDSAKNSKNEGTKDAGTENAGNEEKTGNLESAKEMKKTEMTEKQKSGERSDNKLANAISALMQIAGENAKVDYNKIFAYIDEKMKNVQESGKTEIRVNSAPAVEIQGTTHKALETVLFWAANRQPVYLHGPAGTGKNVLAKQVAEALNLEFYYCGCLQNKYELEGFVDAGGNYQETEFFRAFTKGGVFLFDEIDGTEAEVLIAFNAALANGYYNFPKYGKTKAHEDFVVIAAGNTSGRGATDAYNGRFQLDASTLDRFAFVKIGYDEKIELENAGGDKQLVEFFHAIRENIESARLTYTASPRAMKRMYMGIQSGMKGEDLYNMALCGSWERNDVRTIAMRMEGNAGNKYITEFRKTFAK